MRQVAALLLAGVLLAPCAVSAQELGRLFFTPEQREALDARRRARLPDRPAALAPSPTTRLDGSVKRSLGKSTVWVDGSAVPEGTQPEGLRIRRGGDQRADAAPARGMRDRPDHHPRPGGEGMRQAAALLLACALFAPRASSPTCATASSASVR